MVNKVENVNIRARSLDSSKDGMFGLEKLFGNKKSNFTNLFESALGENLYTLIQYGSSVKNPALEASNINLLIVLNRSTPEAHLAIHQAVLKNPQIEPFILGKRGFERTALSFAVKFLSISRHYKVLSGHDILSNLHIPASHERFLAEQALRNLRLRLIHSYVRKGPSNSYLRFVRSLTTSIFVDISEVLRCEGIDVPDRYNDRIQAFTQKFGFDFSILETLLTVKRHGNHGPVPNNQRLHRNLFILIDSILLYVEDAWNE